jgi:histidine triad (HIT) family protein
VASVVGPPTGNPPSGCPEWTASAELTTIAAATMASTAPEVRIGDEQGRALLMRRTGAPDARATLFFGSEVASSMPPPADGSGPCIFCDIVAARAPAFRVYEDETTLAFLDLFPFTRGHLLVIPKRHGARLTDFSAPEHAAVLRTLERMCRRSERLTPDYNVALNAGANAGQIVFHLHFHVIPRYGEPNPFHRGERVRITEDEAKRVVADLSAP